MGTTKPVLYRVTSPEPAFTGDVGGCHFSKGVYEGEVADGPLAYFEGQGYGIEEIKAARTARAAGDAAVHTDVEIQARIDAGIEAGIKAYHLQQAVDHYEAMTNDELKAELAARSLTVSGNHAELVARLIEADEADEQAAVDAAANSGSN